MNKGAEIDGAESALRKRPCSMLIYEGELVPEKKRFEVRESGTGRLE